MRPPIVSLAIGGSSPVTCSPVNSRGQEIPNQAVVWQSLTLDICELDAAATGYDNTVRGIATGTGIVTATVGSQTGSLSVVVGRAPPIPIIKAPVDGAIISVGATIAFDPTGTFDPVGAWVGTLDLGDGRTLTGVMGSFTSHLFTFSFSTAGTKTLRWTVTNDGGISASITEQISIVASPALVVSVVMSPSGLSLAPSGSALLTCSPRNAAGVEVAGLAVTWLSLNSAVATVGPDTGYSTTVKAVAAGVTTVIARIPRGDGTTIDGSITVDDTPPTPGFPNRPAGMRTQLEHQAVTKALTSGYNAEGCITGLRWQYGPDVWVDPITGVSRLIPTPITVTDVTAGMTSPPSAMRFLFPKDFSDGFTPGGMYAVKGSDPQNNNEMYFAWRVRFFGNGSIFQTHSVLQKLWYVAYGSSTRTNHSFMGIRPAGQSATSVELTMFFSTMLDSGADSGGAALEYAPNTANRKFTPIGPSHWALVELYLKANTITVDPSPRDGIFRLWVDGVLTHDYSPATGQLATRFRSAENPLGISSPKWDAVFGGHGGEVLLRDQYIDEDHVLVAAK